MSGPRQVLVADLAFARAGDKGDDVDVGVFARDARAHAVLVAQLTAERVAAAYGHLVTGEVRVWDVPHVLALKVLLRGALAGGGPRSLRADNLGKAMAGPILRIPLQVEGGWPQRPRPPADPYAGAAWRPTPAAPHEPPPQA